MKIKLFDLDQLPRSSRYFYKSRLDQLFAVCVWAGWAQAKLNKADCPTMDGIWGTVDFSAFVYEDTTTGEVRVCQEAPEGMSWKRWGEVAGLSRSTTQNLVSGVALTGLSVNSVFENCLSKNVRREILRLLPVTGVYEAPIWNDFDPLEDPGYSRLRGRSHAVQSDASSIRDLKKRFEDPSISRIYERLSVVVDSRAVQAGVRVLTLSRPMAPQSVRTMPTVAMPQEYEAAYGRGE